MYERLAAQVEPSSVNEIPLGQKHAAQPRTPEPGPSTMPALLDSSSQTNVAPTFMMASLSNKNKRRGFKQAMASTLPKKIIFSGPDMPTAEEIEKAPLPFTAAPASEIMAAAPNSFPRLIPPSEKQENGLLPPNMFVTSVDVEEGMRPAKKKNKKKAQIQVAESYGHDDTIEVENMVLDYGEADNHIPTQRESDVSPIAQEERDWTYVDKNWSSLSRITDSAQLRPGATVGWKVSLCLSAHSSYDAVNILLLGFGHQPSHFHT